MRRKTKGKKKKVELPEVVKTAKKRRCIDIAIPVNRLWICNVGRTRIAFIKGKRNLPLGVIEKKKTRKSDVLIHIRPFDSLEHEKIARRLCHFK